MPVHTGFNFKHKQMSILT